MGRGGRGGEKSLFFLSILSYLKLGKQKNNLKVASEKALQHQFARYVFFPPYHRMCMMRLNFSVGQLN